MSEVDGLEYMKTHSYGAVEKTGLEKGLLSKHENGSLDFSSFVKLIEYQ